MSQITVQQWFCNLQSDESTNVLTKTEARPILFKCYMKSFFVVFRIWMYTDKKDEEEREIISLPGDVVK